MNAVLGDQHRGGMGAVDVDVDDPSAQISAMHIILLRQTCLLLQHAVLQHFLSHLHMQPCASLVLEYSFEVSPIGTVPLKPPTQWWG